MVLACLLEQPLVFPRVPANLSGTQRNDGKAHHKTISANYVNRLQPRAQKKKNT